MCLFQFLFLRGCFFFQVRPEDPVQQERVNIGRQRETEEKPAGRIKRHQLQILISHKHGQDCDDCHSQRGRKMHEGKENGIFQQVPNGIGKSGDHGEYIEGGYDQKPYKRS